MVLIGVLVKPLAYVKAPAQGVFVSFTLDKPSFLCPLFKPAMLFLN